jgi:hypothetical protein
MNTPKLLLITVASIGAIAIAISLIRGNETPPNKVIAALSPTVAPVVRPVATPAPVGAVVQKTTEKPTEIKARDWRREFEESHDLFSLVRAAAPEGLRGNGAASLVVAKVLIVCIPIHRQFAHSQDPDADFKSYWDGMTHAPEWVHEKASTDFNRCKGFLSGDAFAGLPTRDGGYEAIGYWNTQAVANNDPTAQALNAGALLPTDVESAQESINKAVRSRDPGALFQVGQLLSDGHASSDRLQGFAVALAACDLGADCSGGRNGTPYSDTIKKAVGESGYAQAYARAQAFEDALSKGDAGRVQEFVKLNPTK